MSQKRPVVPVKNKALSACEGCGVLRFVKRMEMCWFGVTWSCRRTGRCKTVQSVSQSVRTEVSRFRFRVHVKV